MTNIISTLRNGSNEACSRIYRKTSSYLSQILLFLPRHFPFKDVVRIKAPPSPTPSLPPPPPSKSSLPLPPPPISITTCSSAVPSASSSRHDFYDDVPRDTLTRSDSSCSCFSCGHQYGAAGYQRRPSKMLEAISVTDFYNFHDILGQGTFSTVYLADKVATPLFVTESEDDESVEKDGGNGSGGFLAAKVIRKDVLSDQDELMTLVNREIQIMSELDHPHIIHLMEVYDEGETVCLIMELAKGGEVFGRLLERGTFTELETANLLVQLLHAVGYIHSQDVVHRDLKLENLLYSDDTPDAKIMVADFGLSAYVWELNAESPVCGTPGYLAPEVISRDSCTTAADLWSVGVITYMLLCGYPPFSPNDDEPDTDESIMEHILKGDYEFHDHSWSHISEEAKDFVRRLMCLDVEKRMTCEEALDHPFLVDRHDRKRRQNIEVNVMMTDNSEKWSSYQITVFVISLLTIMMSYLAMVLYIFNIDMVENIVSFLDFLYIHLAFLLQSYF